MAILERVQIASTPDHIADNLGAKLDKWDPRDFPFNALPDTKIKPNVDLRQDPVLAAYLDEVYNQGKMNSCAANSSAAMYRFEFQRHLKEDNIQNQAALSPSRLFIYYNGRKLQPQDPIIDDGTQLRDALHGLVKFGVCSEINHPYVMLREYDSKTGETNEAYEAYKNTESSKKPEELAYKEALNHKIKGFYRLDVDRDPKLTISDAQKDQDGDHVAANVKVCLSEGHPFVFGFYWQDTQEKWSKYTEGPKKDQWSLDHLKNLKDRHVSIADKVSGHAVVGIGYDDDGVLCQNSWGPESWAKHFWVPWEWITDFTATNDFWMIRVVGE